MAEDGLMSMRRYLLVRAAWQAGVLFAFVSFAYVAAWVPAGARGHDPGYGGFLWNLVQGSLGTSVIDVPPRPGPSVASIVWHASCATLSLLFVTGVFAVSLGALFAFVMVRAPRWRPSSGESASSASRCCRSGQAFTSASTSASNGT